ncbi:hypothetical protein B9Z55_016120 [Caenorhabditis nigoni]|uniref:Uncharacterized protein n=1 Tax=Caenorhabditis nigoni TaxID=1611254 RepID=A0A2G5UDD1_9PELO|nr:hypothetical protein B9Z55_016120 [Caenorhabditis nigoni]
MSEDTCSIGNHRGSMDSEVNKAGGDSAAVEEEKDLKLAVLDYQAEMMGELNEMIAKEVERQKQVKILGEYVEQVCNERFTQMETVIQKTKELMVSTLEWNLEKAAEGSQKFRDNIRELLKLYVVVNRRMEAEEEKIKELDGLVSLLEETMEEYELVKENIKLTQQMLGLGLRAPAEPAVPEPSKAQPREPFETKIACLVPRINEEMDVLKTLLPLASHLPGLMDPVKEQGNRVMEMMLKEFPAKTTLNFLETLPLKQQD